MLTPSRVRTLWALKESAALRHSLAMRMACDAAEAGQVEAEAFHLLMCLAGTPYRAWHRGLEAQKLVAVAWMVAYKVTNDENFDNVVQHVHTVLHDRYPAVRALTRRALCRMEVGMLLALQWRCQRHHVRLPGACGAVSRASTPVIHAL